MSAISQKSITGITSITTPAGVDNQLTLHNNNTTEAVKLDIAGNLHFHNHLNITGVSTASNFKTGTSNLHNTGLNVQDLDVDGQTSLDHTTIAGIVTFLSGSGLDLATHNRSAGMRIINNGNPSSDGMYIGYGNANSGATRLFGGGLTSNPTVINSTGVSIPNDLDVDGHTNLDNVSIAGVSTFSGNVNITNTNPKLFFYDTNNDSDYAIVNNGGVFRINDETNSLNRFSIDSNGNVSILKDLDVDGHTNLDNTSIVGVLTVTSTTQYGGYKLSNNSSIVGELVGLSGTNDTGALALWSGGSKYIQLSAVGNSFITGGSLGIGTHSPADILHLQSTAPIIKVDATNNASGLRIDVLGQTGGANNQLFRVQRDGTTKLQLNEDGDLVITGDDNAELKLKAGTTTGNGVIAFLNSSGTTKGNIFYDTDDNFMVFKTNGTASANERLRITSGGSLLLGATSTSNAEQFRIHTSDSGKAIIKLTNSTTGTGTGDGFEFGMNANEQIEFFNKENTDMFFGTNNTEKLRITKTGSLFLKCLDTVPVNQAEAGHYNNTGYNAGHVLGLMVKRSICVSDADTKGVGGIFLSHTRNVTCDGTTYNMMTLHNREGTFVGDVYVGFSVGGAGVVRHYKFTCLYSASTLTSIDNASRGGKSETISVNIVSSNDAHFFQVIPNMSTNETCRVSMTIVGAACGRNDGAGGDYYTVNYN